MSLHPLYNYEIWKYYQRETTFDAAYSRNIQSKAKDVSYVINVDEYKSKGTHWIALHVNCDNATYFESFRVK